MSVHQKFKSQHSPWLHGRYWNCSIIFSLSVCWNKITAQPADVCHTEAGRPAVVSQWCRLTHLCCESHVRSVAAWGPEGFLRDRDSTLTYRTLTSPVRSCRCTWQMITQWVTTTNKHIRTKDKIADISCFSPLSKSLSNDVFRVY